jgi:hypothetical protein
MKQESFFGDESVVDIDHSKKFRAASASQLNYIHELYNQRERDELCAEYSVRTLNGLSMKEASEIIQRKVDEIR